MTDLKIIFMGTPEFSVNVLKGLIEKYNISLVVTQPDKEVGRKKVLTESPVSLCAKENNIKVFKPRKIREDFEIIKDINPDLIITCAYGQILPKELLDIPHLGCINVHASILPYLRGGAPIEHSIIDGYKKTGVTIMYMDEKMDQGDIISQESIDILDTDTKESLTNKLSDIGRNLLLKTLPSILDGTNKREKQNGDLATYGYNISREEERLDFSKSSIELDRQIRGLYPSPATYCILDGKNIKVYECKIGKKDTKDEKSGLIIDIKEGIHVATSDKELIITKIKPEGKNICDAKSYVNGHDILGKVIE